MSKFKPALATNLHADNWNGLSSDERFAIGFDYDGARYHIWFCAGKDEEILYKNSPVTARRGDANYFDTRKLDLSKSFGLAVLDWIQPRFAALTAEARDKYAREVSAVRLKQAVANRAAKVRDAAPDLLAALRTCVDMLLQLQECMTNADTDTAETIDCVLTHAQVAIAKATS
jgi:hypothetical protein